MSLNRSLAALAAACACMLVPSAAASGKVLTYTGTGTPLTVQNNDTKTSTLTVPAGRTVATDIDVVQLNISAASIASEQSVAIKSPSGLERFVVLLGCAQYTGTTFTLDQQAATDPFGTAGTCPPVSGMSYRPSNSASTTPLTDLNGPSGGIWTLTYDDPGASDPGGNDGILGAWGLRITHAPIQCSASALKQKLRKRTPLTFSVSCNAAGQLATGGAAVAGTGPVAQDIPTTVTAKVTKKSFKRLKKKLKRKKKPKALVTATLTTDWDDPQPLQIPIPVF